MPGDISKLKIPFIHVPPSSIKARETSLRNLKQMLTEHEKEICDAIHADLKKPRQECLALEILPLKLEITNQIINLKSWAGEKRLHRTFLSLMDTASVQPQPYGLVLVIGAWNYPVYLSLMPLVGAIAAGNAVVLKPSELAPETEAILVQLIPQYLDETICQVFTGGAEETSNLLATQRFDYIFYTGGCNAARSILSQAAKHLTPVTLELGGKCPVFVDTSADLDMTAKRLTWAKCVNAGQTCVAPDYVLCHPKVLDKLIELCISFAKDFFGEDLAKSDDFGRIINERHAGRLCGLLKNTKGQVVFGGRTDLTDKFVEFTILKNVPHDDVLLKDEIFGPILPIITVLSYQEAIDFVRVREKPLAIYVYSSAKDVCDAWKNQTSSGSLVFNECIMQLSVPNLPFGGVGNSGMGRYLGEASVATFSNPRSILDKSTSELLNNKFRYPPHTESHENWVRWGLSKRESYCNIL
uniref:Aldehyde dehydrogenase n=1 Tax=Mesocestoides corti TaxID=53468 RepID=A0A5K3FA70_MESCO